MIPVELNTPQRLDCKISDIISPNKASPIDFLELVKHSNSIISTLSTNDNYSIQTDDDISKTLTSPEEFIFKDSKDSHLPKDNVLPLKSLKEIATKRKYVKKNLTEKEDKEREDALLKKRKLNSEIISNSQCSNPDTKSHELSNNANSLRDTFPVPQIITKNTVIIVKKEDEVVPTESPQINKPLQVMNIDPKKVTTSSSFKKARHTEKWTKQETKKFYRALELFGTDFSMIAKLFQTRNRNQIKNKFLKEEKSAGDKINAAFSKTKSINFTELIHRFKEKTSRNTMASIRGENQIVRSQRSGSFHSNASLDSVDMSIMDDLADVFVPSNKNGETPLGSGLLGIENKMA